MITNPRTREFLCPILLPTKAAGSCMIPEPRKKDKGMRPEKVCGS